MARCPVDVRIAARRIAILHSCLRARPNGLAWLATRRWQSCSKREWILSNPKVCVPIATAPSSWMPKFVPTATRRSVIVHLARRTSRAAHQSVGENGVVVRPK